MSESSQVIVEHSEPFIDALIQHRGDVMREKVTILDVVNGLAVPTLADASDIKMARLLIIAGGAASGKSTLAESIAHGLASVNTTSATISSDDFVRWDRQKRHGREAAGMPPEEKYDFFEMNRTIGTICVNQDAGQTVAVPQYDSHTGLAIDSEHRHQIPKVDVLIIEGDMLGKRGMMPQDLYPVPPDQAVDPMTLYVHVPDTVRLARRVHRDMLKRNAQGATPEDIVRSFEHRQATQHLPYTLRYAADADAILMPPAENMNGDLQMYDMYRMGSPF